MFINLPKPALTCLNLRLETPAAGRLAGGFKPVRMPHLAIPGHTLPLPAA